MSGDEQDAAILRVVKQRSEAKKRKLLLESELRSAGDSLYDIGGTLKHISGGLLQGSADHVLAQITKAPKICNLEQIKAMFEELKGLETTLTQLNLTAAGLGID